MTCVKRETALPSRAGADGLDHNAAAHMRPRAPAPTPAAARNGGRVKHANAPPEGVYLPNNNRLAPHMRSPDYVQLSTAAAITLGIMPGKMFGCGCTRCLNLLLTYPEGCRANCAYCGLARHREAERDYADRNFIRVDWPAVPMAQIVDKVASDIARGGRLPAGESPTAIEVAPALPAGSTKESRKRQTKSAPPLAAGFLQGSRQRQSKNGSYQEP